MLITGGCLSWVVYSGYRIVTDGYGTDIQEKTYASIVNNVGVPTGYKMVHAGETPWPLPKVKWVFFLPESSQGGDLATSMATSDSALFLIQTPEDDRSRANREQLYETGEIPGATTEVKWLRMIGRNDLNEFPEFDKGAISGHKYPIKYIISKPREDRDPDPPPTNRRQRQHDMSLAFVDLTPPDAREISIQLFIIRPKEEPITPEMIEEICKNFRPGEK